MHDKCTFNKITCIYIHRVNESRIDHRRKGACISARGFSRLFPGNSLISVRPFNRSCATGNTRVSGDISDLSHRRPLLERGQLTGNRMLLRLWEIKYANRRKNARNRQQRPQRYITGATGCTRGGGIHPSPR